MELVQALSTSHPSASPSTKLHPPSCLSSEPWLNLKLMIGSSSCRMQSGMQVAPGRMIKKKTNQLLLRITSRIGPQLGPNGTAHCIFARGWRRRSAATDMSTLEPAALSKNPSNFPLPPWPQKDMLIGKHELDRG